MIFPHLAGGELQGQEGAETYGVYRRAVGRRDRADSVGIVGAWLASFATTTRGSPKGVWLRGGWRNPSFGTGDGIDASRIKARASAGKYPVVSAKGRFSLNMVWDERPDSASARVGGAKVALGALATPRIIWRQKFCCPGRGIKSIARDWGLHSSRANSDTGRPQTGVRGYDSNS